MSNYYIDSNYN